MAGQYQLPMFGQHAEELSGLSGGVGWQADAVSAGFANYYDPVQAFTQQLGIDQYDEQDFIWIAELGLQSPLPQRWEACVDPATGCTYYIDSDRQTSSWENPLLPSLRRVVELGREYRDSPWPSDAFFGDAREALWQVQRDELLKWHGPFCGEAEDYFVNSATGTTSTRDPRAEAQYVYELQSSFLSSLQEVLATRQAPELSCHVGDASTTAPSGDEAFWRSSSGAEVLTLDGGCQGQPGSEAGKATPRLVALQQHLAVDHTSTLQRMTSAVDWLRAVGREEEEAQKLRIAKAGQARKQRRQQKESTAKSLASVALRCEGSFPATRTQQDAKSAGFAGRRAPQPLRLNPEAGAVQPPQGQPSPANLVRPPSALSLGAAAETLLAPGDELPRVSSPSSLSLRKRRPEGGEWAAEAFLAAVVAPSAEVARPPPPPWQAPAPLDCVSEVSLS